VVPPDSSWVWNTAAMASFSCDSPAVVNNGKMCQGDPTSIVFQASGQAECLSSQVDACKFNMHDLEQLDFDVNQIGCKGTWAAPLWMTPDTWKDGPNSGEIDMMENCPYTQVRSNFAGDSAENTQISWTDDPTHDVVGSGDDFQSHTTLRKQAWGDGLMSIFVRTCKQSEVGSDGSCPNDDGQASQHDIYGKNGCSQGNCMYRLVSDLWNGVHGDAGWTGCTAGGNTNYGSQCKFSVTNIKIKGPQFSGSCAALSGGAPTPGPPPPSPAASCDAHPACSGLQGDCCPTGDGVMLGCCGGPSPPPPPPPPSSSCDAHPACQQAGLLGDCCPTSDGVTLGCCSGSYDVVV